MKILDKSLKLTYELFPSLYEARSRQQSWHFTYIFDRTKLLSIGRNNYDFNGRVLYFANKFKIYDRKIFPSKHSEFDCIARLWGRFYINSSLKLVNVRINKFGILQDSKPCKSCQELLDSLGIHKIWYSTKDGIFLQG